MKIKWITYCRVRVFLKKNENVCGGDVLVCARSFLQSCQAIAQSLLLYRSARVAAVTLLSVGDQPLQISQREGLSGRLSNEINTTDILDAKSAFSSCAFASATSERTEAILHSAVCGSSL